MFNLQNVLEIEAIEAADWIRGKDAAILARLTPLVRERTVLLDFSRVRRIDAAGLAALVTLYRAARDSGHSFAITNPAPHVAEILAAVGLDSVLLNTAGYRDPTCESCLARNAA